MVRIETIVSTLSEGLAVLNDRMANRKSNCPHLPELTRAANNVALLAMLDKAFDEMKLVVAEVKAMACETKIKADANGREIVDMKLKQAGYAAVGSGAALGLIEVVKFLLRLAGVSL